MGTVKFTTGPTNTTATIYLTKTNGTGDTYGDDITVIAGNVGLAGVLNPGFEAGSLGTCGFICAWTKTSGTNVNVVNDGNAQ